MSIKIEDKKVVTPKFRVSFPQLDKPKAFGGGDAKYSVTMLFAKDADITTLKKAALNAATEKWGGNAKAMIEKLKKSPKGWPFRDGDREKPDMPSHKGMIFISANAKESNQPQVIGPDKSRLDPKELYAGAYARAELLAYAYDNSFGKGIGFSLQNLQKLGDGQKFTGKKAAEDVFDAVEDQSDDPTAYENEELAEEDGDDLGF